MAIAHILWSFWYIFSRFGMLLHERSGSPGYTVASVAKRDGCHRRKKWRHFFGGKNRKKCSTKPTAETEKLNEMTKSWQKIIKSLAKSQKSLKKIAKRWSTIMKRLTKVAKKLAKSQKVGRKSRNV
jgi:hypothetical protein